MRTEMSYATFGFISFSMNVGGIDEAQLWACGWPVVCDFVGEGGSLRGAEVKGRFGDHLLCGFSVFSGPLSEPEDAVPLHVVLPTVCGRNGDIELVLRTDDETA